MRLTRQMLSILEWAALIAIAAIVVILAVRAEGQAKTSTPPTKTDEISELQRLKLINTFQQGLLVQSQWTSQGCADLQPKVNAAFANWNKIQADVAKEMGQPEGTTFQIDLQKQLVHMISPPPPKTPEPAKK